MFFNAFRKFPVLSQHFLCGPSTRITRSLRQISFFAKFFKRKPPAIKCDIVKDKKGTKCVCTPYDFSKPQQPETPSDKVSPENFFPLNYKGGDPVTHNHNPPLPMANYQEIFGTKTNISRKEIDDVINRKEKRQVVLDPESGKAEVKADDDDCEKKVEEVIELNELTDKNDNFCTKPPPPKVEDEEKCDKTVGVKEEIVLMKKEEVTQQEACKLALSKGEEVSSQIGCYVEKEKECVEDEKAEKSGCETSKEETCPVTLSSKTPADGKDDCCEDREVVLKEDCADKEKEDLIQLPECVLNSKSVLCKKPPKKCPEKVPEKKCKEEPDVFFHRETVCLPDCDPKPEKCTEEKKPKCKEEKKPKCKEEKKPVECEEEKKQVECEEERKPIRCDEGKKVKAKKKKASGSCASNDPYCCIKNSPKSGDSSDRLKFISLQHFWRQQEKKIPKNCSKFVSAPTRSLVDHILRKEIGGRLFQNSKYLEVFCKASFSECGRCGSPKFEPDARRRKRRYEFFDSDDSGGQCNRCRKYEALESDACARCAKYEVYKDVENGIRKKDLVEEEEEMPKKEICEEVCKQKIIPGTCIKPSIGQEDWHELRTMPVKEIEKALPPPDTKKVAVSKECIRKKILSVLKKDPKPEPVCPKPGAKKRFQLKKEVFKLEPPPDKKNYLQKHLVQPKKIGRFFSNKLQESAEPKLNTCKTAEKPVAESKRRAAGYLNPPTPQPDPDDVRNEVCRRNQPPCRRK